MSKSQKIIGILWFFALQPAIFFFGVSIFVYGLFEHFWK
jgi:hypothetical protein